MITAHVEVQEVHHAAMDQPVKQIADGAAQNQRQSHPGAPRLGLVTPQQHQYHAQRHRRKGNQQRGFQLGRGIGKHAEGRAAVLHVGEAEQPRDDRPDLVQRNAPFDDGLGGLVKREHRQCNQ